MYEVLLACNVALLGIAAVVYLRLPCASIMHPGTWIIIFHGIIFVIRPILANYYSYDLIYKVYQFTPSQSDKITAILIADLSFLVMLVASCRFGNLSYKSSERLQTSITRDHIFSFYILAAIATPLAVYSLGDAIANPVREEMEYVYQTGQTVNTIGNGYTQEMQALLIPIVVGWVWINKFSITSFFFPAVYMISRAATGGRWPIVICFIWIMILYLIERRKRWIDWRYAVGALAIWAAFVSVGSDRGDSIRTWLFGFESRQDVPAWYEEQKPMESMDYGNLEYLEYVVYVVPQRSMTYDYYLTNSRILTEPVPRVLWKEKPVGAPYFNVNLWDYGTPIGMTFSVAGVGWFDAGWIGVILWSALFGSAYGWFYSLYVKHRENLFVVFSYSLMIALSLLLFRDGVLLSVLKFTLFTVSPILIWRLLNRGSDSSLESMRLRTHQQQVAGRMSARQRLAKRSILGGKAR